MKNGEFDSKKALFFICAKKVMYDCRFGEDTFIYLFIQSIYSLLSVSSLSIYWYTLAGSTRCDLAPIWFKNVTKTVILDGMIFCRQFIFHSIIEALLGIQIFAKFDAHIPVAVNAKTDILSTRNSIWFIINLPTAKWDNADSFISPVNSFH